MQLNRLPLYLVAASYLLPVTQASTASALPARDVDLSDSYLTNQYTATELAVYRTALGDRQLAPEIPGEQCRLSNENDNRCGDDQIPAKDCPDMQDYAYNDGNGCINGTEYNFAVKNVKAPFCSPLNRKIYVGWCRCGCFDSSTHLTSYNLLQDADEERLVSEFVAYENNVYAMTEMSTMSQPEFEPREVIATTVGPEEKPLVWVELADGTSLGLTEQHAVLLSTGEMITARELDASLHQLVKETGEFMPITKIEHVPTSNDVFNVLTDAGLSHTGHMIIANGYIVGDLMWQATLAADLHNIVVRM